MNVPSVDPKLVVPDISTAVRCEKPDRVAENWLACLTLRVVSIDSKADDPDRVLVLKSLMVPSTVSDISWAHSWNA